MSLLARCMIYIRIMSGYYPLSGYYPDTIRILSGYIMSYVMLSYEFSWFSHIPPSSSGRVMSIRILSSGTVHKCPASAQQVGQYPDTPGS